MAWNPNGGNRRNKGGKNHHKKNKGANRRHKNHDDENFKKPLPKRFQEPRAKTSSKGYYQPKKFEQARVGKKPNVSVTIRLLVAFSDKKSLPVYDRTPEGLLRRLRNLRDRRLNDEGAIMIAFKVEGKQGTVLTQGMPWSAIEAGVFDLFKEAKEAEIQKITNKIVTQTPNKGREAKYSRTTPIVDGDRLIVVDKFGDELAEMGTVKAGKSVVLSERFIPDGLSIMYNANMHLTVYASTAIKDLRDAGFEFIGAISKNSVSNIEWTDALSGLQAHNKGIV